MSGRNPIRRGAPYSPNRLTSPAAEDEVAVSEHLQPELLSHSDFQQRILAASVEAYYG
jgi:hypothetical protein